MFGLTKTALRRPVSVFLLVVALLFFGVTSVVSTPLELIPNIEMPYLIIYVPYPGAPPEDVESLVTEPVEDALSTVSGVKNVQSISSEHVAMIGLEFNYGTNLEQAHTDVQNNLELYKSQLPEDAGDPTIVEISMSMMPTMTLSASATGDVDLSSLVKDVVAPELERLAGVASVSVAGGGSDYIQVELNEQAVQQYGLNISTIAQVIGAADFSMPVGTLAQGDIDLTVRGGINYPTMESLREIPITLRTGDVVRLSDIASISYRAEDTASFSRYNGMENMSLVVSKRSSASTLSVTRAATRVVNELNARNLGFRLGIIYDASDMILQALSSLVKALLYGVLLAMAVLFLFFGDWRASLIVGTSIPVSLLVTICAMSLMGFTFNMMSIGGLVVGIGMMVDNSIVVIESCFRMRESGLSMKESALEGTRIVSASIFASTLTTIVVFLPIAFLKGMSGELFSELCFTIVFSLAASLLSAVTLAPLVFYRIAPVAHEYRLVSRVMNTLYGWYGKFLPHTYRHKWIVVLVAVLLLVGSASLLGTVGVELLPATDEGTIQIDLNTRPGLSSDVINEKTMELEALVASHPDVDHYYATSGGSGLSSLTGGTASANITAYLKKGHEKTTNEIIDEWRAATAETLDCTISVSNYSTTSLMTGGADVTITLESNDLERLKQAEPLIVSHLEESPYIVRASSNISAGTPQAEIHVDPIKAAANGLVPASVLNTVYTMIGGKEAMTLSIDGRDYSVKVEYPKDRFSKLSDLDSLMIPNAAGMQVPLYDIATIEYSDSPSSITRYNGMYQLQVKGQKSTNAPMRLSADLTASVRQLELPDGVEVVLSDDEQQIIEEFTGILRAIVIAIFLVFLVMAMQFESPRLSIAIMISLPFAAVGSFLALFLTNTTLNMPSLMGFLMLVGIVVNNGILLIDTANGLRRDQKIPREDALLQAGMLRMRPIFMTSLTTILAMVPTAVSTGGNGRLMSGMAWVIIGGMVASTLLTLMLLPAFYLLLSSKHTPEEIDEMRNRKLAAREARERERAAKYARR